MAESKAKSKKATATTDEVKDESIDTESSEVIDQKPDTKETKTTTKAGKRSKKAQAEEAEKEAKQTRKQATEQDAQKSEQKTAPQPKATMKNPLHAHGKRWQSARKQIEDGKHYGLAEAVELVQKLAPTKFDATLELHVNLGIDPRQSDQSVRTSVVLPAGTGKKVRIAVIADAKGAAAAKAAGADLTDAEKIQADTVKNKFDFDVLITTPDQMPVLAKHAKILGPKGLMPSPKAGTVTSDLAGTIAEIKAGKAEIKTDSAGIVHLAFGKASFKTTDLINNAKTVLEAIMHAKPAATKGTYFKSITMSASMSPSVRLDIAQALKEAKA